MKSAYEIALEKIANNEFPGRQAKEKPKKEIFKRYLSVGDVHIVGEDHSRADLAWDLINELQPDILCLEEPQDCAPYFRMFRNGASEKELEEAISVSGNPLLAEGLLRKFPQLAKDLDKVGVDNVYFTDLPSYILTITPFFLQHDLAVIDDMVRNLLMSTRAFEVKAEDSVVVMNMGAAHEPGCYDVLLTLDKAQPNKHMMDQQRLGVYQLLQQIIPRFSEKIQVSQATQKVQYLETAKMYQRERDLIFGMMNRGEDIMPALVSQMQIANDLAIMSYDMHRRNLPQKEEYHLPLLQIRDVATGKFTSGDLEREICTVLQPV